MLNYDLSKSIDNHQAQKQKIEFLNQKIVNIKIQNQEMINENSKKLEMIK